MLGNLTIIRLLQKMKELQASDLHIKTGSMRDLSGCFEAASCQTAELAPEDTQQLLWPIVPEN